MHLGIIPNGSGGMKRLKSTSVAISEPSKRFAMGEAFRRGLSLSGYLQWLLLREEESQPLERLTRIEARLTALETAP